ncbi:TfoX/Sxy family DNA transformation protein [Aliivibrio sp. S3MY1]|uniref:TfoX/Sxy family DNA transformation protein n=1 Tax=Aliivibrio sp. S3MY1 TaxID=3028424 RepID=UPI002379B980|nr:TfoX/Sxy family DNA transformation protein [Aliivibrio sp. S3MY1]MDD9195836.1 TfoX/Sxy family DNA transformation protein [Aliivibrio sp. S3MY1]
MENLLELSKMDVKQSDIKAFVYELAEMLEWDMNDISYRQLFGGGLFTYKDVMFLKVHEGAFYFRVPEKMLQHWISLGSQVIPKVNNAKSGNKRPSLVAEEITSLHVAIEHPVSNPCKRPTYFSTNNFWYSIPTSIMDKNKIALILQGSYLLCAKEDKNSSKVNDLRKLPNITAALKRILIKAGVNDIPELEQMGAVKAFRAIRKINSKASYAMLFSLHAALNYKHYSLLTDNEREVLVKQYEGKIENRKHINNVMGCKSWAIA